MEIARERQLDWLLGEVLGGNAPAQRPARLSRPRLMAALIVLGAGVAFGVAALRERDGGGGNGVVAPVDAPQDPAAPIPWVECHGDAALGKVPEDVTALHCFDFTDAGLAGLGRFTKLTHLDLSGTDVDNRGWSKVLVITDAGVEKLATLTGLRWLSLAQCHDVQGTTLGALRAIPQLEHLDLTYTGLRSEGIAQLPQLPSLRELALSSCMDFHGRSLADVAKLPGLRRLELRGCATLQADDVKQLAALHELRHLDLRDCMGAFRGQTMSFDDITNGEPPAKPTQDAIGVTDEAIAALVGLPLETLLLDGCRSLTDGVADSLGKLKTLRAVGLGELPKISATTLLALPAQLRELSLRGDRQLLGKWYAVVAQLTALERLDLSGMTNLDDAGLAHILESCPLRELDLSGEEPSAGAGPAAPLRPRLTADKTAAALARVRTLERLGLRYADGFDAGIATNLAQLPRLTSLDLQMVPIDRAAWSALGGSHSLRELRLVWARGVDVPALDELGQVPLQDLDLYGCRDLRLKDMGLFESWPGVRVRLPNGARYVEPARPTPK
ncbi:MAG: hypothetical protein R3F29_00925 [Planctomycetota bacterium]